MFKETVEVVKVTGEQAIIKFEKRKSCDCCRASGFCNKGKEQMKISTCGFSLQAGNRVEVEIGEKKTLQAGSLLFFLPALLFIVNLALFRQRGELVSFFLAFLSVCLYYVVVKVLMRKLAKRFAITIVRKL